MNVLRSIVLALFSFVLRVQAGIDRITGFPLPFGMGVDISVTAGSVLASASADIEPRYTAGGTLTAGMEVVLDDNEQWVAYDSNGSANHEYSRKRGQAQNGAASGQRVNVILKDPDLTVGGTLTVGLPVFASDTAGGKTHTTPTSNMYCVVLGVPKSTTKMNYAPVAGGTAVA
jgi:hypothetical protein